MSARATRFEALVRGHSARLFRFACGLCGDRDLAEDLVQETFTRAWRSLDQLAEEKAALGWLMMILRRENARRFERIVPLTVPVEDCVDLEADIELPEAEVEHGLLRERIQGLAPEYREPLLMQVLGGMSSAEIGAALELAEATVNTRLFRARKMLEKQLAGDIQQLRGKPHG